MVEASRLFQIGNPCTHKGADLDVSCWVTQGENGIYHIDILLDKKKKTDE